MTCQGRNRVQRGKDAKENLKRYPAKKDWGQGGNAGNQEEKDNAQTLLTKAHSEGWLQETLKIAVASYITPGGARGDSKTGKGAAGEGHMSPGGRERRWTFLGYDQQDADEWWKVFRAALEFETLQKHVVDPETDYGIILQLLEFLMVKTCRTMTCIRGTYRRYRGAGPWGGNFSN